MCLRHPLASTCVLPLSSHSLRLRQRDYNCFGNSERERRLRYILLFPRLAWGHIDMYKLSIQTRILGKQAIIIADAAQFGIVCAWYAT
jgi:hypothetical protein